MSESGVQAVERAIDIIFTLGGERLSLAEISASTGLSKSTAHRLLSTLKKKEVVQQDSNNAKYYLSVRMAQIARMSIQNYQNIIVASSEVMQKLQVTSEETVTLHVKSGRYRVCLYELESKHPIKYTSGVGATAPIHVGAASKILLAFLPPNKIKEFLKDLNFEVVGPNTITDPGDFYRELNKIVNQGYAISFSERVSGASCASVPLRDARGDVVGALSILGPSTRLNDVRIQEILPVLIDEAKEISAKLGYREMQVIGQ